MKLSTIIIVYGCIGDLLITDDQYHLQMNDQSIWNDNRDNIFKSAYIKNLV